jgi:hypothetical protein
LNHLVSGRQQRFRYGEAKQRGGLQIDDELELGRLQHRHLGGLGALKDAAGREPLENPSRDLARGNLTFILHGKRLKGRWHLVHLRGRPGDGKRENWLLIKGKDEYAEANGDAAIEKFRTSVVSRRGMEGIAGTSGKSWGRSGARQKSPAEAFMVSKMPFRPRLSTSCAITPSISCISTASILGCGLFWNAKPCSKS